MKIPNGNEAIIPPEKLVDYLLSQSHPIGRFKAVFFESLGFTLANVDEFESALRSQLLLEVDSEETTDFGRKCVISGRVAGPDGKSATITTVWIILNAQRMPRLVTAFPGDET